MTLATPAIATRKRLIKRANKTSSRKVGIYAATFAIACVAIVPDIAAAAPWDSVATRVLEIFTGGLTRTIAIVAVIACGIAAMAGKLSWDWVIKIIVGVVLIFGSAAIVDYIIAAAS